MYVSINHLDRGQVFLVFVNGDDGIACLNFQQFKKVLDEHHDEQEWVRVSRKPKQNYRITAWTAHSQDSFPKVITEFFNELLSGLAQ